MKFRWTDNTEDRTVDDTPHFMDAMAFGIPFNGDVTPGKTDWPKSADDWLATCGLQGYHMGAAKDVTGAKTNKCGTNLNAWMGIFEDGEKLENFTAVGLGTVTGFDSEELPTATHNRYDPSAKTWTVVFQRPLNPSSISPNMVKLEPGRTYLIGYVQWDGALSERDGRKFVTEDWADSLVIEAIP
jgi:DMSO reductase family type II enzyme heme b subunit